MADLLEQGSSFLDRRRHEHMSRPVVYRRGGQSVALQATVGRTVFEQADQFGVVQRTETRDYLIRAEDLVLGGERTLPKAGDLVHEPSDGSTLHYEVMAPGVQGGNEPPFRFSDPYRRTLRVHTKFIGVEVKP